ncbi:hypothetical protein ACT9XH_02880 [Methanococcoides methylutens]|uniref:hypothetical protein n=1 Tax=Methanococcoides methylutens TaxID=2226 RepID=UPI0040443B72
MEKIATRKLIRTVIVPLLVSALIVVSSLTIFSHGLLELVGLLLYPASPIIYGWVTRDKVGAVIVGTVPIVAFFLYPDYAAGYLYDFDMAQTVELVIFLLRIMIIGGLGGYFASKRELKFLIVAIALVILWFLVFMYSFHFH